MTTQSDDTEVTVQTEETETTIEVNDFEVMIVPHDDEITVDVEDVEMQEEPALRRSTRSSRGVMNRFMLENYVFGLTDGRRR